MTAPVTATAAMDEEDGGWRRRRRRSRIEGEDRGRWR